MAVRGVPSSLRNLRNLSKYDPIQVNHMSEMCIAVNEHDEIVGEVSKVDAHALPGMALHRAFSVFAFTPDKKLILQKRSASKITFPSLWTNTCCSHPLFNDEEMDGVAGVQKATIRKLDHELNIGSIDEDECLVLGRYLYKATMADSLWGEHELDYGIVLRNLSISRVAPNPEEVDAVCAVSETDLTAWIHKKPEEFSPWFSLFVKEGHLASWWKNLSKLMHQPRTQIIRLN